MTERMLVPPEPEPEAEAETDFAQGLRYGDASLEPRAPAPAPVPRVKGAFPQCVVLQQRFYLIDEQWSVDYN